MVQIFSNAVESEMKDTRLYTEYHPKWYRAQVSTYWWIRQWSYFKFILRELTSISIAYFVVITLLLVSALSRGPDAYAQFQGWLETPLLITLNGIGFFFVLYHAITWFNLAPKALAMRVRGKRISNHVIVASNYSAWLAISAVVAWLLLRD